MGDEHNIDAGNSTDRRLLRRVLILTLPLFVLVVALLPNGPVFRTFATPSTSMEPACPLGSYQLVSRLAYGYTRT